MAINIKLIIAISLVRLGETGSPILIVPILIKFFADFILLYTITKQLKLKLNINYIILLSLIHPFYIVAFGLLGPLVQVEWKK